MDQNVVPGAATTQGQGSGYHASIEGSFSPVTFRLAYLSGTTDDPADATDDALSSSSMLAGIKVGLGENFSVAVDYSTKTLAQTKDTNNTSASSAVQFVGKNLGPGDLILTYATETNKDDDGNTIDTNAWINLAFDLSFGDPSGKFQLLYLSKANTPDGGDTVTASFVGIGLVKFF
jgi:hypothetical protein